MSVCEESTCNVPWFIHNGENIERVLSRNSRSGVRSSHECAFAQTARFCSFFPLPPIPPFICRVRMREHEGNVLFLKPQGFAHNRQADTHHHQLPPGRHATRGI